MLDDITVAKVQAAITGTGNDRSIALDIDALDFVRARLSLGDFGRFSVQVARAAAAKRPSELQRLMLALVTHREGGAS